MKIPDSILTDYFRLTTDIPEGKYGQLIEDDIRAAHIVYAQEIVRMYHGDNALAQAENRYLTVASGNAPEQMDELFIKEPEISIIDLLKQAGFASSNSDARRLILGKGIKVNGETLTDMTLTVKRNVVLCRGKNKFVRVRFS